MTSNISVRYNAIRVILTSLASEQFSIDAIHEIMEQPVLKNSVIITSKLLIREVWAIKRGEITTRDAARFLSIVYSADDVVAFMDAYDEFAPDCYNQDADRETSTPWCMPWLASAMGAEETDTPESLGKKTACADYDAVKWFFENEIEY